MSIYSYPFESHETGDESNPYDRAITAAQERMFNKLRYANGVFNPDGGALQVKSNSNMTVTVGVGGCHIEGAITYNDAPITLPIEAASATLNRIDRVVAQFNTSDSVRATNFLVRTGTAATNPIAPELRREPNFYELALADIYVGKNTSSISTANITDQRLNNALCGQVIPAIPTPIDTSDLWTQYQASLNEWLDTVAAALDGTLAGNLQSQITDLANTLQNQITNLDTIAPNGIVDMLHGGTGADNAPEARQNINFIGTNPIASISEDTPEKWKELGTGIAYISVAGLLNNQPYTYGFIENRVSGNLVSQTFYSMSGSSTVWHRSGNSSGWYSGSANWVKNLDENYVPDILSIYNSQQTVFSTTKSVIAFDTVKYSTTDKLGMSNNGIKILSDKVNKIKVSALLRLNPNTTSTCGIYVYLCKNGTDLTNFSSIAISGISVALSIVDYYIDVQKDDIITFKMVGSVANTAKVQANSPFTVEVIE